MELEKLIKNGDAFFVLNMSNVNYIASAAFIAINTVETRLRQVSGKLVFSELSRKVKSVFNLLSYSEFFDIFETDSQAIDSFK